MSVTLSRPYQGYASGATVTLPDSTESALIAQGIAVAANPTSMTSNPPGLLQTVNMGGNQAIVSQSGISTPAVAQGPSMVPNTPLGAAALTSYDTNGRVHVAGTMYWSEVYVPATMTATGIGVLNGTVVGTDNLLVALYDSNGKLLANSAVAGALSAGASAFQNIAFTSALTIVPGRYFIGVQCNGTTATTRRLLVAAQPNTLTKSATGTFGTVPASFTPPTTPTDAAGVIGYIYS